MTSTARISLAILLLCLQPTAVSGAEDDDIEDIRREIAALKTDYEQRIALLEERLLRAEQEAAREQAARTTATSRPGTVTSGNAFNPQISVILDGNFYRDSVNGEGSEILESAAQPSQPPEHGHDEHGGELSNGFNIRTVELAFIATVDPYFDASAYLTVETSGAVDIEEAWFATRNLPSGFRVKAGKFLSDFGYLNNKHEHQWDFADQNLPYLNLLGDHGLQDSGVQLTWLPELPVYTMLGVELLQGEQERIGTFVDDPAERADLGLAERKDGPRMLVAHAKLSPDFGYSHAMQIGGSYVHHRQHQEVREGVSADAGLEGDADLWAADFIYRYDNPAAYGHRDLSLQAEYLRSAKDLTVMSGDAAAIGARGKLTTDGLYLQGLYGVAPRWQLGLRYDTLGMTNKVSGDWVAQFEQSDRWTGVLTWTPTEFSRFRLQYSRSDIADRTGIREAFNTLWLQFLMSLGAHGAHEF